MDTALMQKITYSLKFTLNIKLYKTYLQWVFHVKLFEFLKFLTFSIIHLTFLRPDVTYVKILTKLMRSED